MKKIIALLLALTLCFSVLPVAFAANIGRTTENLKRGKVVFHVGDDVTLYKQALVDVLDSCMAEFMPPQFYFSGVWNEAGKLYTDEVERIYSLTELNDLIVMTYFGAMANETTMEVCTKLEALAELNKSVVSKAEDLKTLKTDLKKQIGDTVKYGFSKENYNDYYWDTIVFNKDEAFEEIEKAETFADFAFAKQQWQFFFDNYELDADAWVEEFLEKAFLSNAEMESLKCVLGNRIYEALDAYVEKGHEADSVYTEKVYARIDKLYAAMDKAQYAGQMVEIFEEGEPKILALAGVEQEEETKTPATVSFKKRMRNELNEYFYNTYQKSNYSDYNWYELTNLRDVTEEEIFAAEYQEDLDSKFLERVQKKMAEVPNYAKELKEAKKAALASFKEYVGSKKYNQTKVKKLVAAGTKKVKAATKIEDVYDISDKYLTALEKTVIKYKITVTKVGKGSVSKSKTVEYGERFTVKITPAAGYKITSITIDGKKVKLTNAYTFKKVTKAHSIKVTFGK